MTATKRKGMSCSVVAAVSTFHPFLGWLAGRLARKEVRKAWKVAFLEVASDNDIRPLGLLRHSAIYREKRR